MALAGQRANVTVEVTTLRTAEMRSLLETKHLGQIAGSTPTPLITRGSAAPSRVQTSRKG